ncbi:hypothetical protein PAXINDRAFT_88584, partial [Paxillus involutus ATCC 200175]
VTFVWSRRGWSAGKALFAPTRYIPFILIPLTLFSTYGSGIFGPSASRGHFHLVTTLVSAGIPVAFGLRAYAMWNRSKAVLAIYCCIAIAYVAATAFIFQLFFSSVTFGEPPLPIISGCYRMGANSVIFASFVVVMVTEAVTTTLILYRAFRHFRHTPNALIQNMTRDGVFYCFTVFLDCRTDILDLRYLTHTPTPRYQAVIHTILATRMQIHLRKVDQHTYLMGHSAEESLAPMSFTTSTFLADT